MATPAEPTAPQPAEIPAQARTSPAPGLMAQLLTPVEPVHGAGSLGSTTVLPQPAPTDGSTAGGRSAGQGGTAPAAGGEGAFAALLRGLGARLARGGTARKITHTVNENRVSGATSSTTSTSALNRSAKDDRSAQHRTARDSKLADLKNKTSQQQNRRSSDAKDHRNSDAKTADSRTAKTDSADRNGRDVKQHRDAKTTDSTSTTDSTAARKDSSDKRDHGPDGSTAKAQGPKGPAKDGPAPGAPAAAGAKPATDRPVKVDLAKKPETPDGADTAADPAGKPKQDAPAPGPKPRTQPSREAGYRDGLRTAAATGHVKAWRDGYRDGLNLGQAAYQGEKERMDTARDRNATRPPRPAMAPAGGTTADLTKKTATDKAAPARPAALPVQVDEIGHNIIRFTADGQSHDLTRGEVRTFKAFTRRIATKQTSMDRIAEAAKTAVAAAAENAKQAQQYADSAKNVKGGDAVVQALTRLAEQAQLVQAKAEAIHKRALRGSEALQVLAANVETRHGGMYQAVADSPLTKPGERFFYQDKQGD